VGCTPTSISVRPTRDRRATCTGESRPSSSITSSARRRAQPTNGDSPARSRCGISALPRLGDLHVRAAIVRTEGVKTYASGCLADADGVTVEAEGLFIQPRWARD
jgi:hypothetical protein